MEINIRSASCRGEPLGRGLDYMREVEQKKVYSEEDTRRFHAELNEYLKYNARHIKTTKKDDFDTLTSYISDSYKAGNCLVENTLSWGAIHIIDIAGKQEDIEKTQVIMTNIKL